MKYLRLFILFVTIYSCSNNLLAQVKPNILWITIEDTSPQFIGCYGNKAASTPYIDKLASTGIRFTNAFSTNTVCSPSRTTIITGVRSFETGTGHHRSKYAIPDFMHGFPYYMQQQGYFTSNNSKTDYNVSNAKKYISDAWNQSNDSAGWWNRKPGQSFFAVFNFNDSHQSRTMTFPYNEYKKLVLDNIPQQQHISEDAFEMPPIYRNSPEMRKQLARVYNSIQLTDNKIGHLLQQLEKDNLTDSTIIFFFSDHGEGIPRGKTNGISFGYRVAFVAWFPPMYKDLSPWGTGVVTDELISFEDLAPTLISLSGGTVPAYMKGRSLIGKNRSAPAPFIELSSDRSDNGIDMVRSITDGRYIYSRNFMPFMPEGRYINYMEISEMKKIMRRDLLENNLNEVQKRFFEPRPAEFLFDTQQDPWEINNLAGLPSHKALLDQMRRQLDKSILQSHDVMFLPEYELAALTQKNITPYEYRTNKDAYPLKEIYAAALLSGRRDPITAGKQVKLLDSKNKIVRYWAALGLRSQKPEDLKIYKKEIINATKDTYPLVRITAAAIAYDIFSHQQSETLIRQALTDSNPHLALTAANYLLYVENKQPFIPDMLALKSAKEIDNNVERAIDDFLLIVQSSQHLQHNK